MEYNLLDLMESSQDILECMHVSDCGVVGYPSASVEWRGVEGAVEIKLTTYPPDFPEAETVAVVAQGSDDASVLVVLGMLVESHMSKFPKEEPNAQESSTVSN